MFTAGFALATGLLLSSGQLRNPNGSLVTPSCEDGQVAMVTSGTWGCGTVSGGGLPSGAIVLVASGTCPAGYAESAALNGKFLVGTVAANGNVGTTGGSDTITPAGTNGTSTVTPLGTIAWPAAVPAYTGALGTLAVTAHTVVATKQGAAAGNVVTTATHTVTGAPGGTVAWPAGVPTLTGSSSTVAAQTFTGTQFDNRPAFARVIACAKS